MSAQWNERQVSHTYSVTGEPPIKQLAVIRAQQLGLTGGLAAAQVRADLDLDRNLSRCSGCRADGAVSI